jgi:hypothetical protein
VGTSPPVGVGATMALVAGEARTLLDDGSAFRR